MFKNENKADQLVGLKDERPSRTNFEYGFNTYKNSILKCPVCGKRATTSFYDDYKKCWTYKHNEKVKTKHHRGTVLSTYYHEVPLPKKDAK